jgi:hypothetical protein
MQYIPNLTKRTGNINIKNTPEWWVNQVNTGQVPLRNCTDEFLYSTNEDCSRCLFYIFYTREYLETTYEGITISPVSCSQLRRLTGFRNLFKEHLIKKYNLLVS